MILCWFPVAVRRVFFFLPAELMRKFWQKNDWRLERVKTEMGFDDFSL
jgi:hypothetical protein